MVPRWSSPDASTLVEPFYSKGDNEAVDNKGMQVRIHEETRQVLRGLQRSGKRIAIASLNNQRDRCISLLKTRECIHCFFPSLILSLILSSSFRLFPSFHL